MYLYSPTVRPKDIVRLFGDPLIQDSLSEDGHQGGFRVGSPRAGLSSPRVRYGDGQVWDDGGWVELGSP